MADLSNTDKHRVLNLIYPRAAEITFKIAKSTLVDCVDPRVVLPDDMGPLHVGTELGRVYVTPTGPNPNVTVQSETFVQPTFENGLPATAWLRRMFTTVESILARFV